MNHTIIEGIISGLDRTTEVSGGSSTMTTTTYISIFSLSGERVLLNTHSPAMIADGDHLKVVGVRGQGQFTATACKNITTGWVTPYSDHNVVRIILIGFTVIGVIFTVIFPLFFFLPLATGGMLFAFKKMKAKLKDAHRMLDQ